MKRSRQIYARSNGRNVFSKRIIYQSFIVLHLILILISWVIQGAATASAGHEESPGLSKKRPTTTLPESNSTTTSISTPTPTTTTYIPSTTTSILSPTTTTSIQPPTITTSIHTSTTVTSIVMPTTTSIYTPTTIAIYVPPTTSSDQTMVTELPAQGHTTTSTTNVPNILDALSSLVAIPLSVNLPVIAKNNTSTTIMSGDFMALKAYSGITTTTTNFLDYSALLLSYDVQPLSVDETDLISSISIDSSTTGSGLVTTTSLRSLSRPQKQGVVKQPPSLEKDKLPAIFTWGPIAMVMLTVSAGSLARLARDRNI